MFKRLTAGGYYRMMRRLVGKHVPAQAGDFRLLSRAAVEALRELPEKAPVLRLVVPWLGFPSGEVRFQREERAAGRTKYPLSRMVGLAADSVTSFSAAPLRVATWLGLAGVVVCGLLVVAAVIAFLSGATIAGWPSLYIAVLFLGAVQLLCLGLLGEYVARIYTAVQGRPAYFVAGRQRRRRGDTDDGAGRAATRRRDPAARGRPRRRRHGHHGRQPAMTATADRRADPRAATATRGVTPGWARCAAVGRHRRVLLRRPARRGTAPVDLVRYGAYVVLALMLPGTLVYRALRRTPHTLVEDLAMGIAVGLVLELPAWAVASPCSTYAACCGSGRCWSCCRSLLAPRLRRHWRVRGYTPAPLGWSWTVGGAVAFFTTYLSSVFLQRNPILPTDEGTLQYLDLAYQLSLAGEAKHHFPLHVPQVADEPLYYHWFGYVHMAATSMIGEIDLPVVALRLTIPGLCALAVLLTAVVGWRLSGQARTRARSARSLFFVVGETNFTDPVSFPFGTQATFVVWHGMSMIYSWVLLIAAIAVVGDVIDRRREPERPVPALGRRAFVLVALFALASSGAKASSLPVLGVALLVTAVAMLFVERRIPWGVVVAGLMTAAAQLFATAVLYRFQAYGVALDPWLSFEVYTRVLPEGWTQNTAMVGVVAAFLVNMQLRATGILPLIWLQRGRLVATQWLLLGGSLAGTFIFLMVRQAGWANQYFERAGFAFAVLLSGLGLRAGVRTGPDVPRVDRGARRLRAALLRRARGDPVPVRRRARGRRLDRPRSRRSCAGRRSSRSSRSAPACCGRSPGSRGAPCGVGAAVVAADRHPARRHARPDHGHAQVGAVPQRRRVRRDPDAPLADRGRAVGTGQQRAGRRPRDQRALPERRPRRRVRRAVVLAQRVRRAAGAGRGLGCSRRGSPRPASSRSGTRRCSRSTTRRSPRRRRRSSTRCAPAGCGGWSTTGPSAASHRSWRRSRPRATTTGGSRSTS